MAAFSVRAEQWKVGTNLPHSWPTPWQERAKAGVIILLETWFLTQSMIFSPCYNAQGIGRPWSPHLRGCNCASKLVIWTNCTTRGTPASNEQHEWLQWGWLRGDGDHILGQPTANPSLVLQEVEKLAPKSEKDSYTYVYQFIFLSRCQMQPTDW